MSDQLDADNAQNLRDEMLHILGMYPYLCVMGQRVISPRNDEAQFQRWRDQMTDPRSLEEFAKARTWWKRQRKVKNPNPRGTSRGLLAIARHEIGPCSNGCFQAGAISCGFSIERDPGSWAVWVNVSGRAWDSDA